MAFWLQKPNLLRKNHEKQRFVKLCFHFSYTLQNTFHFHEIFYFWKIRETLFTKCRTPSIFTRFLLLKNSLKNSWNFVYILAKQCRTPSIFTIFFLLKIPNFAFEKNSLKNSWNFVYILVKQCRTPSIFTRFFYWKFRKKSLKNSWNFVRFIYTVQNTFQFHEIFSLKISNKIV